MRRNALHVVTLAVMLTAVTATVLLMARRSRADQVCETFSTFTFSPATATLAGTNCLADGGSCETVYLTATDSTTFVAASPVAAGDPFYGVFTAWNTLVAAPNQIPKAFYGLLVAISQQGGEVCVMTSTGLDAGTTNTISSIQPVAP